ncbi:hypothetical protein RAK27_19195 [Carnobacterium maltaromaticum]|uniref:Uncharacterized protein n=1 Tax=Carnobacterium maltaromaticum TaxID=2751 RepID=A0AAW9K1V7_CARML|nr:hypothetical protein [Carnobacterium maltaromaticum]MDZ5760774.1 hypothetical protein [Carnobacterium maltaromaticum]
MYKTSRCIEVLKEFGFEVFGKDVQKDEIESNKSFFIFDDDGDLSRESANVYNKAAYVAFVTTDGTTIPDELEIIAKLQTCGLRFDNTENDEGKMKETEQIAKMRTWNFHQSLKVCING